MARYTEGTQKSNTKLNNLSFIDIKFDELLRKVQCNDISIQSGFNFPTFTQSNVKTSCHNVER